MFVLRPLIYVLLVRKYGTRSWFPWFISLAVDLIGNSMLSAITMSQDSRKDQHFQFSKSEKDEVRILYACCFRHISFINDRWNSILLVSLTVLSVLEIIGLQPVCISHAFDMENTPPPWSKSGFFPIPLDDSYTQPQAEGPFHSEGILHL